MLRRVMLETRLLPATAAGIAEAARLLAEGALVAVPTETVYGLAADATDGRAVAGIFGAKGRPSFNPLIVHLADCEAARRLVAFDPRAERLAAAFWPGPLTMVLPRRPDCPVSELASAGLPSLAVRVPAHPVARRLLALCGRPLAAPSANRSGQVSPTRAEHVMAELDGRIDAVLDAGPCAVGVESTIVGLADGEARLLRPGGVAPEAIEALIGPLSRATGGTIEAPGMLESHYAPARPVRLDAATAKAGEALLAFGPPPQVGPATVVLNLSPAGDLAEAAANLFAHLRALDRPEISAIAVMPVPQQGLGLAINDRLRRAAAPRPGDKRPS